MNRTDSNRKDAPARAIPRLRGLPVFGFAVAGLLLGHTLSYLLALPDPSHRDLVLNRTGHGYLPAAGDAALILALAGVAALVVRAWSVRGPRETRTFASPASLLAVVQVVAFGGQEVLERLVAGAPLGELADGPLLLVGVVVQIAVALVGAAALGWLARASARIAQTSIPAQAVLPGPPAVALVATSDRPLGRVVVSARNVRAPPSD